MKIRGYRFLPRRQNRGGARDFINMTTDVYVVMHIRRGLCDASVDKYVRNYKDV